MNAWKSPDQQTVRPRVRKISVDSPNNDGPAAPSPPPPGWLSPRFARIAIGLLLVLHAGLAIDSARRWTVTHDEIWHLPVGLANLKTGRFDYETLNPPLMRMVAALPLLLMDANVKIDAQGDGAVVDSENFYVSHGARAQSLYFAGRCMVVLVSLLGAVLLARWLWTMAGPLAAVLGTALWTTDPTMIANAAVVTTDLVASTCFIATLYALWKTSERPGFLRGAMFGVVLGLSQLVKFTCVLLVPLSLLLWALMHFRNRDSRATLWGHILCLSTGAVMCVVVWNAGFLFHGSFEPLGDYRFGSRALQSIQASLSALKTLPVPLPRDYLNGIDRQQAVMESQHPVYLDGVLQLEGFPNYYLMTVLYKIPHAAHFLLLLTLLCALWDRGRNVSLRLHLFLLIPAAALFAVASLSSMQLGLRYILPSMVLLFAWGAIVLGTAARNSRTATVCLLAVAVALFIPLRGHPNHLGYFNEFAGGMENGWRHLIDSNIDWGQDLHLLPGFLKDKEVDNVTLAYFGTVPPTAMGLEYDIPPRRTPQPGWHAISVCFLAGRPHVLRTQQETMEPAGPFEFSYFQLFEPVARLGSSIYVYHLTEEEIARVSRQ